MTKARVAIVGAAESTHIGKVQMSQLQLHADAAINAMKDAGLKPSDIDGIATCGEPAIGVAGYLGIEPAWVDATEAGGCSFLVHLRHAIAAIEHGLCNTVLITHGESGRSKIGPSYIDMGFTDLNRQFELPFGAVLPLTLVTLPVTRYLNTFGVTPEQLATVPVIQREWAARNPRAAKRDPLTIEDVLASGLIVYPLHRLECCLVTDGGGALLITKAERAKDFPNKPVYVLGTGEAYDAGLPSQVQDFNFPKAFTRSGPRAFQEAGIKPSDVDHLMIYDAFAHLPMMGLEALGFVAPGEGAAFICDRNTAPGGRLPLNTNGGGLSYTHSGRYGMFAMMECVRQVRGSAAAQVSGVEISVAHAVGGMLAAGATVVMSSHESR